MALAATNKAVAELRGAGLDAVTIARFRLDGTQLAPGTVVILDEVSQVSTRDARAVLDAVAVTPQAMLWCLGDDDQGRPVRPGGLAAELHRLTEQGEVMSAELTVNRRQHDPAERDALAAYRDGGIEASQTIRTEHGWEHQHATPADTRAALAAAAVADADLHGVEHVVVLAVSHADCEDLADRIRRVRATRGELTGPELEGPGWGLEPRRYAAGDRLLCHANLTVTGRRLVNGTAGTIVAVTPSGLVTRLDDGGAVVLPPPFVAGTRPDGTPNLSHGWARTIDGAQGGTWDQVYLLATPNLDRLTAYVGQSRGRQPTHTWNTVPDTGYEHSNVVTDPRTPAEHTLAAMARLPERQFAAYDDPTVLDRRLRTERAEQQQALTVGPPDVAGALAAAVVRQERDERLCRTGWDDLTRRDARVAETAGLHQLRPSTRRDHRSAVAARDAVEQRLHDTQHRLRADRTKVLGLQTAAAERQRWETANAWRHDEIGRIDRDLADHWADTVLAAVHQDDPLTYGLDRLRAARATLAARSINQPDDRIAQRDRQVVEDALCELRVERVSAIAAGQPVPECLIARLGPVPRAGAGRDAWCGLALTLEEQADRRMTPDSTAGRLDRALDRLTRSHSFDPLDHPRDVIAAAELRGDWSAFEPGISDPNRWQHAVQQATNTLQAAQRQHARAVEHDLGLSL